MAEPTKAPDATVLRLSRYHCFIGQELRAGRTGRIRSREMAAELGVSEETVRRDLSYAHVEGRPGAGYELTLLLDALEGFLDLSERHPFVTVANEEMLQNLTLMFPAETFGLRPVGYFSARPEDAGSRVEGIEIHSLSDLPDLAPDLGATIALVACEPDHVDDALGALKSACINGVLMLTPVLRPNHPEGMNVTYFRIPCALKSLVSAEVPSCCAAAKAAE
jgi:NADH/NAD ratio-sensing transcriptional regulator Rex